jgi:hypothetical protein
VSLGDPAVKCGACDQLVQFCRCWASATYQRETRLRTETGVCTKCQGTGCQGTGSVIESTLLYTWRTRCPACNGTGQQPAQPDHKCACLEFWDSHHPECPTGLGRVAASSEPAQPDNGEVKKCSRCATTGADMNVRTCDTCDRDELSRALTAAQKCIAALEEVIALLTAVERDFPEGA